MEYTALYKCLCDATRLRILNLLRVGPLCVCHIQEILGEPQAKVSKQLGYMKRHGLLTSIRHNNWTIYRIAEPRNALLDQNLSCLQDTLFEDSLYQQDLKKLSHTDTSVACTPANKCCNTKA